jgi:hypothetical protein
MIDLDEIGHIQGRFEIKRLGWSRIRRSAIPLSSLCSRRLDNWRRI